MVSIRHEVAVGSGNGQAAAVKNGHHSAAARMSHSDESIGSLSPPPSPPPSPTHLSHCEAKSGGLVNGNGHGHSAHNGGHHGQHSDDGVVEVSLERSPSSHSKRSSSSRKSPNSTRFHSGSSRIVEEVTVVCEKCFHPNNIDPLSTAATATAAGHVTPAEVASTRSQRSSTNSPNSNSGDEDVGVRVEGNGSSVYHNGPIARPPVLEHQLPQNRASPQRGPLWRQPRLYSYNKREERRKTYSYEGLRDVCQRDDEHSYGEGLISAPPIVSSTSTTMTSSGGRIRYPQLPPQADVAGDGARSTSPFKQRQKSSQSTLYPRVVPSLSPRSADGAAPTWPQSGPTKCKVIVLGNSAVGKTSIIYSHKYGSSVRLVPFHPTIGANYVDYDTVTCQQEEVQLQIWDTAGMERFRCMVPMYMRNADAAILVYDITDRKSFNDVDQWLLEINRCSNEHDPKVVLVGNKTDRGAERRVAEREGMTKAARMNAKFYEISAIDTPAVDAIFAEVAKSIHERNEALRDFEKLKGGKETGVVKADGGKKSAQQCCALL